MDATTQQTVLPLGRNQFDKRNRSCTCTSRCLKTIDVQTSVDEALRLLALNLSDYAFFASTARSGTMQVHVCTRDSNERRKVGLILDNLYDEGLTDGTTLAQNLRALAPREEDDDIKDVIADLRVPIKLFDSIKDVYNQAIDQGLVQTLSNRAMIAVCSYIVCRVEKEPLTLLEASDSVSMSIYDFGARFKEVMQALSIVIESQEPAILTEDVLDRIWTLLKLQESERKKIVEESARLVHEAEKKWLCTGRHPQPLVAAAIKLVVESHGESLSFKEIAQSIGKGQNTIRDRYKELRAMCIKMGKELKLLVDQDNLVDYVQTIIADMAKPTCKGTKEVIPTKEGTSNQPSLDACHFLPPAFEKSQKQKSQKKKRKEEHDDGDQETGEKPKKRVKLE